MGREYFNAYHSYRKAMENLNDAERGRLFMACLKYSETGEIQPLRGNERFVWPSMQSQIDRDIESYARISSARSEAGKKAASERWENSKRMQTHTSGNKNAKEKEKEKEKEKRHTPELGASDSFSLFWKAYPKKRSKGDAEKAFKAIKPSRVLLNTMLAAIAAQKAGHDWQKESGKYIPYPATWLRAKGWEDEVDLGGQKQWREL